MEWSRAKNIIIVSLVLLNIMLGVLMLSARERHTLSAEQERNITAVLYRENISMNTPIIRRTPPMRMVELAPGIIDGDLMKRIFLGTTEAEVFEYGAIRMYYYNGSLVIVYANRVIFENGTFEEFREIDFEVARRMSDEFLEGLGDMARGFALDVGPYFEGDEIIVEYRQRMDDGVIIYNNYFLFAIDNHGIRRIEHSQNLPIGISPSLHEICGADEALFSFLRAMRVDSVDRPKRVIEKMDIVYFMDHENLEQGIAYPYFRIYFREYRDDGSYVFRRCMVNAYFGTWRTY